MLEKTILHAKPHWIYLARPALLIFVGLTCSVCSILTGLSKPSPGRPAPSDSLISSMVSCSGCILMLGLILTILMIVMYFNSSFTLTNRRVIIEGGILNKKSHEIFLNKVESVYVERPLLGRMIGYGNIVITGSGGAKEPLRGFSDPQTIRNYIQEQVTKKDI
jgi:uncharacterized membrane protein YdbT with pleckstrin-like domain